MKKLTKTQQEIMETLYASIKEAKSVNTFEEYFDRYMACRRNCEYNTIEKSLSHDPHCLDSDIKWWEMRRSNIDLIYANTKTIQALEKAGYIEIVKVGGLSADCVKVLK